MLCRCNWLCLKNNNVYLQVCKKKKDWGSFTLSSWWYPTHAMPLSTCRLSMFSPVSQNLKYIFNQLVVGRLRGPESPVSPRHITRDNSHIQRTQLLRKYIELKVYLPYSRSDLMNNEQASDWTGTRSLRLQQREERVLPGGVSSRTPRARPCISSAAWVGPSQFWGSWLCPSVDMDADVGRDLVFWRFSPNNLALHPHTT